MERSRESAMSASTIRPAALGVLVENIPGELTVIDRWVVWRYVMDFEEATGEVSFDKPPINARTGKLASSTDPETWTSFANAWGTYQRGSLDGIGFVLHREQGEIDGIVGIDLDKCRDLQ